MTNGEPVVYHLSHWPVAARNALRTALWQYGIDAAWQNASFSVPASRRAEVDRLVAALSERREPGIPATVVAPAATPATVGAAPSLYRAEPALPPAGWYADPTGRPNLRWWDGHQWTDHVGPSMPSPDRGWLPPPDDREQSARGGGIAIAGFVVGQLLSIGAVLIAIALGAKSRSVATLIVGELALWFGLFGACRLAVRRYGSGSLRDLGLQPLRAGDFGIGALAALVARFATLIIAVILILVFSFDDLTRDTSVTDQARISTLGAVVVAVIAIVGAPFFEELYFRGLVQGVLTRRYGSRVAIVLQAIAFAAVHYQIGMTRGQAVLTFATILPVGMLLGILRWRYQRLGPGMVTHAAFNAIAVAVTLATL